MYYKSLHLLKVYCSCSCYGLMFSALDLCSRLDCCRTLGSLTIKLLFRSWIVDFNKCVSVRDLEPIYKDKNEFDPYALCASINTVFAVNILKSCMILLLISFLILLLILLL